MKTSNVWGAKNTGAKFAVNAADLEGALDVLMQRDEWGKFKGDIPYNTTIAADGNVTSVTIKPTYSITMPSWGALGKQPKKCQDEWKRMYAALEKHEIGHKTRFENGVKKLEAKLKALKSATQAEIDTIMADAQSDIQGDHDSYDSTTANGSNEGVELTIEEECQSKK